MTLPTARRTAVVVAPSATWWMREQHPEAGTWTAGAVVVGGPDLVHVDGELAALGDLYGHHAVVRGAEATVAEVLRRVAGADVAHIAAHGHFRADSPMFSSLQMHDGPLNIHDLQGLHRVPRLVVLTACDAGRSGVLAGDELLGTVAALLSLGVSTVIAPLLPIADQPASRVAVALHRELVAGRSPAQALASVAMDAAESGDGAMQAAAMSFLCIGTHDSGDTRISAPSPTSVTAT
jgi:CHAT domain-containing protein